MRDSRFPFSRIRDRAGVIFARVHNVGAGGVNIRGALPYKNMPPKRFWARESRYLRALGLLR